MLRPFCSQKLTKSYSQKENHIDAGDDVTWDNLDFDKEKATPIFHNNRCVFYKACLKDGKCSSKPITLMVCLLVLTTVHSHLIQSAQMSNQVKLVALSTKPFSRRREQVVANSII